MSIPEAIKRVQKKYHDKFEFVRVRMTAEKLEQVKAFAEANCESVSAFTNRVIDEAMARGKK